MAAPLLGAHLSIAGGLHLAIERGALLGCTAIQIFTKNATQWRERAPDSKEVSLFAAGLRDHAPRAVLAHAGYLINLGSPHASLWEKSVEALVRELERCRTLGLPMAVLHPGSHGGSGENAGLKRAARGLRRVIKDTAGSPVRILLEITAGQGNSLGCTFEHLAFLLAEGGPAERLGLCFDTAHAFAAGYDFRTPSAYARTMDRLDKSCGLTRVRAIHVNDAKKGLGSRVDRHEQIGRGALGLPAFRLIMRDERFRDVPKILETPKYDGEVFMDPVNLAVLRRMASTKRGETKQ
jgi:deoxyribonuclease-4